MNFWATWLFVSARNWTQQVIVKTPTLVGSGFKEEGESREGCTGVAASAQMRWRNASLSFLFCAVA